MLSAKLKKPGETVRTRRYQIGLVFIFPSFPLPPKIIKFILIVLPISLLSFPQFQTFPLSPLTVSNLLGTTTKDIVLQLHFPPRFLCPSYEYDFRPEGLDVDRFNVSCRILAHPPLDPKLVKWRLYLGNYNFR